MKIGHNKETFEIYTNSFIVNESFLTSSCISSSQLKLINEKYVNKCHDEYKYTALVVIKQFMKRRNRKVKFRVI